MLLDIGQKAWVLVKDPKSGKIIGPFALITWGMGYACVSTDTNPDWVPAKNIRPFIEQPADKNTEKD